MSGVLHDSPGVETRAEQEGRVRRAEFVQKPALAFILLSASLAMLAVQTSFAHETLEQGQPLPVRRVIAGTEYQPSAMFFLPSLEMFDEIGWYWERPACSVFNYEAEVFFRRMVSNSAWERLSELEKRSRRLDGAALYSDLSLLRTGATPFDLTQLEVPTLYAHGDAYHLEYYRSLCRDLRELSPLIETCELERAGHGAHLSQPDLLASLILNTWRERCVLE